MRCCKTVAWLAVAAMLASTSNGQKCLNRTLAGYDPWFKQTPSPGGPGFRAIARPWNNTGCCTQRYSVVLEDQGVEGLYNFTYNQCNRTVSQLCRQYLLWEETAYSCDPYFAYYEDQTPGVLGYGVLNRLPVCRSFCDDWFNACADDLTCVTDWLSGFDYTNGVYSCPAGSTCQTFRQRYTDGAGLCNAQWGNTFVASSNESACFNFWWWGNYTPNAFVVATPTPLASPSSSRSASPRASPSAASTSTIMLLAAALLALLTAGTAAA